MCDLERLLTASLEIARLKREASLRADAISALKDILADRDQEIALLKATLALANGRLAKVNRAHANWAS